VIDPIVAFRGIWFSHDASLVDGWAEDNCLKNSRLNKGRREKIKECGVI